MHFTVQGLGFVFSGASVAVVVVAATAAAVAATAAAEALLLPGLALQSFQHGHHGLASRNLHT